MDKAMIRKINTLKACCYGNEFFLDNANDHHTKFETCLIYFCFHKNPRSKQISQQRFVLQ